MTKSLRRDSHIRNQLRSHRLCMSDSPNSPFGTYPTRCTVSHQPDEQCSLHRLDYLNSTEWCCTKKCYLHIHGPIDTHLDNNPAPVRALIENDESWRADPIFHLCNSIGFLLAEATACPQSGGNLSHLRN